jgi:non-ribosomal peptide synthetase component F
VHTIADPINHALRNTPDRLAVVCGDVRLTYREVHERCRRLAAAMAAIGMLPGDRIAILAANSQALPKSGPGKVLKRGLRAPYWRSAERQIN